MYMRRAKPEDYHDVLAIGDIHHGVDYVQHLFATYAKDPLMYCYVQLYNNTVIGFKFFYVVEDGKSLVSGGLRIHPNYRGKNLHKELDDYAVKDIAQYYPAALSNVTYIAPGGDLQHQRLKKPNRSLLEIRVMTSKKASMAKILDFMVDATVNTDWVHHPCKVEFIREMSRAETRTRLFPSGYMNVEWLNFSLRPSDLSRVYDISHVVWSTGENSTDPEPNIGLISFIEAIPCTNGVRLDVGMYGQDTTHIAAHIYTALKNMHSVYPQFSGNVELMLYNPLNFKLIKAFYFQDEIAWEPGAYSGYDHAVIGKISYSLQRGDQKPSKL